MCAGATQSSATEQEWRARTPSTSVVHDVFGPAAAVLASVGRSKTEEQCGRLDQASGQLPTSNITHHY